MSAGNGVTAAATVSTAKQVELLVGHGDCAESAGAGATEEADRGIERIDERHPADPLEMTLGVQPGQVPTERMRHQDDRRVVHDGAELAYECFRAPTGQPTIPALGA